MKQFGENPTREKSYKGAWSKENPDAMEQDIVEHTCSTGSKFEKNRASRKINPFPAVAHALLLRRYAAMEVHNGDNPRAK